MSTTTGQPTNAVFGFTSMLINLLRDEEPTHVGVAFDVSRKTFRTAAYADYKAGRQETPDDFRGQVTLIREVLEALRIPSLAVDGFEADDVIATLTVQAEAAGFDVLICTGDRDALQLVDDHVTVLYPKRGVSDLTRFTPGEVQAKYGLTPRQYPDYAALRGDPSDNLPGIPGVGEKTAAKWVREYGSLDEIVAKVDTVGGKVGDALRANLGSVVRNRQLTELVARRRARPRRRRSRAFPVGPRRGPRTLRRPAVQGAARSAVRDGRGRRAGGRPGLRRRGHPAGAGRGRALARRARPRRQAGRGRLPRGLAPRHRDTRPGSPSPPRTTRPPTSCPSS